MTDHISLQIRYCDSSTELYRHYDGQHEAQSAYIELGLRDGVLLASYDALVGGGTPTDVRNGFDRRYPIPVLTGEAANRVMEEIAPFAHRVLADWVEEWDGNNMVVRLGPDAEAAEEHIMKHLGCKDFNDSNQGFADSDLVTEWDVDGAINGFEVENYGITADTTDERLQEIEADIVKDLAGCGGTSVVVVHGLDDHLKSLRKEQRDKAAEQGD